MGELLSTGSKPSQIVTLSEGTDDRIVLVEQMWKYKKDVTRLLLLKHGFVVTTTASGKKTKRDIVFKNKHNKSTRVIQYLDSHDDHVYSRILVQPRFTEEQLQEKLDDIYKHYHFAQNNCWHFSHDVVLTLEGRTDPHPYLHLLKNLYMPLFGWIG
jgi:hypothetical protein